MKIFYMLDTPLAWQSGIWFHRIAQPGKALDKRGHGIKQIALGNNIPDEILNAPDTVIFGRVYPAELNVQMIMAQFKKAGKRVLYDMDDDYWLVSKDNPSHLVSNAQKDQYEGMIRECDAVITPSKILKKKFEKFGKPVFICPNGVNLDLYHERPKEHGDLINIGYMGASSHWKDLQLIGPVLEELYKKYDFLFTIYGITGDPIEAAMYYYNRMLKEGWKPEQNAYFKEALEFYAQLNKIKMHHIPFYPPELHPSVLSRADFDIGLAPLQDTEFNRGKSCIKFYEYAAVGTVTLASDVEPYKSEVNYRAKNTQKDWYDKLERLIVDKDFREKILKEQQDYVKKERSLEAIGLDWELACQKPGGLKVLGQQR